MTRRIVGLVGLAIGTLFVPLSFGLGAFAYRRMEDGLLIARPILAGCALCFCASIVLVLGAGALAAMPPSRSR